MSVNLFLTGPMRYGKSTLLSTIIKKTGVSIGGYFVQRLMADGATKAFRLADISCEPYIPDIELSDLEGRDIQTYSDLIGIFNENTTWHPEVFENTGVSIIRQSLSKKKQFLLMDEIGRIELKAPHFQEAVFDALIGWPTVLGVLKQENNQFLDAIRNRDDVFVLDLNYISHEAAAIQIIHSLIIQDTGG
ncbi:MAG TPA: nucleoside-triphosphatase [Syntrophomonadaceae bacterium]|nr:nucleoside-triphosphatase [Syntrophomonadaceae bacterium]